MLAANVNSLRGKVFTCNITVEHLCRTLIIVVIFKLMHAVNIFRKRQSGVYAGTSSVECERVFETGMLHNWRIDIS